MRGIIFKTLSLSLAVLILGACSSTKSPQETQEVKQAKEKLRSRGITVFPSYFILEAEKGNIENVKLFLKAGIDVNTALADTALLAAIRGNQPDTVEFLLKKGADPNLTIRHSSPLGEAASLGYYKIAKDLIEHGAKVNLCGQNNDQVQGLWSPLFYAARSGHPEVLQLLIKEGANVNYTTQVKEYTPLSAAVSNGNKKCVKKLIAAGANVNYILPTGYALLDNAVFKGHNDISKMLVEAGANVNRHSNPELASRAMLAALVLEEKEMVDYLIDKGANPNAKAYGEIPILVWCAKNHLPKAAVYLIKKGAKKDVVDDEGASALDYAILYSQKNLIKYLDPSIDISKIPDKPVDPNIKQEKHQVKSFLKGSYYKADSKIGKNDSTKADTSTGQNNDIDKEVNKIEQEYSNVLSDPDTPTVNIDTRSKGEASSVSGGGISGHKTN